MNAVVDLMPIQVEEQPHDVRNLTPDERDGMIISAVKVDGTWHVLSRYGDDVWEWSGGATNVVASKRSIDFRKVPAAFRAQLKAMMYRYRRRGRAGWRRPQGSTTQAFFMGALRFLRRLEAIKIKRLSTTSPMVCAVYVQACRDWRTARGEPLKPATMVGYFLAVEAIHELSQFTNDPMPAHPWPESSAWILAGQAGTRGRGRIKEGKTPLIPDTTFCALFQAAWALVERADSLLSLRNALEGVQAPLKDQSPSSIAEAKNMHLAAQGWTGGLGLLRTTLTDLRTACYIVIASLSGCRNHELAHVQSGAYYKTEDDDGQTFWWMKSRSDKTGEGYTEWMVPESAVTALRVMDRWAEPYQSMLVEQIERLRAADPTAPAITESQRHVNAVFLGVGPQAYQLGTLSTVGWRSALKGFAHKHNIRWDLSSHQFRRTFANYAARSQFGDLRYLKEHFKHWSFEMTLGYALNGHQEMALYSEVYDELANIKEATVSNFLAPDTRLAGGFGKRLMAWRNNDEAITIFPNHQAMVKTIAEGISLRSNGHAWCSADRGIDCVGNGGLDRTRCIDCDHSVIGLVHARMYQGLYDQLKPLLNCDDIGDGGLERVRRDISRCADALRSLGYDPEQKEAA